MAELKHLHTAWDVDRHIVLDSAEKLVLVRFSAYECPPTAMLTTAVASPSSSSSLPAAAAAAEESTDRARKAARREGGESTAAAAAAAAASEGAAAVSGMEHYLRTQQIDALLVALAPKVRRYCVIYAVDTNEVPEFNDLYELGHDRDPFAVMFFYRNQHIRVDVGTGNHNKINFFAFEDMEEDFVPIVNAAFRAGKSGRGMANSERKFSTVSLRR